MISVDTKMVMLLGNPLGQSFSTKMQNAGFRSCELDFEYLPVETTTDNLAQIVAGIRHMNIAGFGVTKPDKVAIMEHLDYIDEFAAKMGAVNTVVLQDDGSLKGYNTDGIGFMRSLKEQYGSDLSKCKFICLGAGGAARAICSSLAQEGVARITVSSLYDDEAKSLVEDINKNFAKVADMVAWEDKSALKLVADEADVIMNTTGVGMGGYVGQSPVDPSIFHSGMLAYDAAYNPAITKFLQDAKNCNCEILNGLGMLLYQGTAQFEMWTGHEAPTQVMKAVLEEAISNIG